MQRERHAVDRKSFVHGIHFFVEVGNVGSPQNPGLRHSRTHAINCLRRQALDRLDITVNNKHFSVGMLLELCNFYLFPLYILAEFRNVHCYMANEARRDRRCCVEGLGGSPTSMLGGGRRACEGCSTKC
jgi:hypothetical protein